MPYSNLSPFRNIISKKASKNIALCLGVLIMSFLIGYLVFAWTEPTAAPPGYNVSAPINVGSGGQRKTGALNIAGGFESEGVTLLATLGGTVGIGTATPDTNYKLDVNGKIATLYKKDYLTWPGSGLANQQRWKADINKDGTIDFYDLRLLVGSYLCSSTKPGCDPNPPGGCWDCIIGVDNLGNYLYEKDADLNGLGTVDLPDLVTIANNFDILMTPYTRQSKIGDIDKDGTVNYRDFTFIAMSYGCNITTACGNDIIGADNLGNRLYKKNTDLSGNTIVDLADLVIIADNYEPVYNFISQGFQGYPAGRFIGGTSDSSAFALKVENSNSNPLFYIRNDGNVSTNGDLTVGGGTGKINVGTIDPIFDINGKKYATYMADFAGGTRVETSGIIQLKTNDSQPNAVIDFDELKEGSDLWLFWQVSNKNINDLTALLTPGFEGKVWYEKNGNKIIIYGDRAGEVSYRLSAPRVDYQKWGNLTEDQNLTGIKIFDY
jgi:hypothetical protein